MLIEKLTIQTIYFWPGRKKFIFVAKKSALIVMVCEIFCLKKCLMFLHGLHVSQPETGPDMNAGRLHIDTSFNIPQ